MAHIPHAFLKRQFLLLPFLPLGMSPDPPPAAGGGVLFAQVMQGGLTLRVTAGQALRRVLYILSTLCPVSSCSSFLADEGTEHHR